MWHLCQASPLQISPVGVCPSGGPLPQELPTASQSLPGIGVSMQIRAAVERHARAQLAEGPWAPAQWAQMPPMSALPLCQPPPGRPVTPYQQAVQPPGKSTGRRVTFDSSIDKTAPAGGQTLRTAGDRGLEGREMVANLPITPGECKRRQVGRRLVRRVISPSGQHQMFPQPQHLKVARLSRAVGQGLCPMIPPNWLPNTIARDGKRTLSMCSRSTTSIMSPPIRR